MIKNRTSRARDLLGKCEVDAFVFLHLPNIRYLCNFSGSDGALIVTAARDCFLTDSRYAVQAREQVTADEVRQYQVKLDGVVACLLESGAARIGFEAAFVPFATVENLRSRAEGRFDLVPVEKEVPPLRGIKDAAEIRILEETAALAADAFDEVLPLIRPGVRESEIALALEFAMRRRGAEDRAFDLIVASGHRGAMPHGVASDKLIASGELVTIDFGARYQGYHSDETVTLAVGDVSADLRQIFDLVAAAQQRAIDAIRPGAALADVDAAARSLIAEAGFGEHFGHGLGHGVGLEIHEYPTVNARTTEYAQEGMVLTVEPGIYVEGLGGVRIEDTVLVTAAGCRRLTRLPKGFRSLTGSI